MLLRVDRLVKKPGEYLKTCEIRGFHEGVDEFSSLLLYEVTSIGIYWRFGGICCLHLQGIRG